MRGSPRPKHTNKKWRQNNYYPFGLQHQGYNDIANSCRSEEAEAYKFLNKEYEDSFALNVTETDFRHYDSALGRFNVLDPMAELAPDFTPYRYGFNNPVFWSDSSGLFESYDAAEEYRKSNKLFGATITFDAEFNLWKIDDGISIIAQIGEAINRTYEIDGEIVVEQTRAGGKSNLEKGLRTVADFTPFIGGAWDVVEGLENGDYLQVTIGAGSLILDAATMGVGGTILKGGLKTVIKEGAEELAEQGLKQVAKKGKHLVYEGIDSAGNIKYVGITKRNASVRFGEHLNSFGTGKELLNYRVMDGATELSKTQARVLEQTLINRYGLQKNGGQLLNKINSIAPVNWGKYGIQ